MSKYEKQDTPLYRFKLCEDTGDILVSKITHYRKICKSEIMNRYAYLYDEIMSTGRQCYQVYDNNLDKFVNWKVYSFNPDLDHAKFIMYDAINQKAYKAYLDHERWTEILGRLK